MNIKNINKSVVFNFLLSQLEKVVVLLAVGIFAYSVNFVSKNVYVPEEKEIINPYDQFEKYLNRDAIKKLRDNYQFKEMLNASVIEDNVSSKSRKNPFDKSF